MNCLWASSAMTPLEVDVDATGAARFIVERDRTGERTFMLHHVHAGATIAGTPRSIPRKCRACPSGEMTTMSTFWNRTTGTAHVGNVPLEAHTAQDSLWMVLVDPPQVYVRNIFTAWLLVHSNSLEILFLEMKIRCLYGVISNIRYCWHLSLGEPRSYHGGGWTQVGGIHIYTSGSNPLQKSSGRFSGTSLCYGLLNTNRECRNQNAMVCVFNLCNTEAFRYRLEICHGAAAGFSSEFHDR